MIARRTLVATTAAAIGAGVAAAGYRLAASARPRFVELAMSEPGDIPTAIAVGPDGTVWFTLDNAAAIGRIRGGRLERLTKPGRNLEPVGLAVTADGAAWFADLPAHALLRVDPSGAVSSVALGTPTVRVGRIAAARDGSLWFAEGAMHSITRLAGGVLTRHSVRYVDAGPFGVSVAPDGVVWATLQRAGRLVRIEPGGRVELVELPRSAAAPSDLVAHADGSVSVLAFRGNRILRWRAGRIEEVELGHESAGLSGLAAAPDGSLWFAMARRGALGRLAGSRIETFPLPRGRALPFDVAVDPAGTVWYTDIAGFVGRLEGVTAAV